MKKLIIKIAAFFLAFGLGLFIFSALMNREATEITVDMKEASLPVTSVVSDGFEINDMYGYTGTVDKNLLRDSLTPLEKGRTLSLLINTYGDEIKKISYEVRSADAARLVENTEVTDFKEENGKINLNIQIKDLIESDKEYIFGLNLTDKEGREIYYTTRIIYAEDFHQNELLKFATNFSTLTFDKEKAKSLISYLESDSTGDNSTFAHVNIHSSFDQITWGNLNIAAPEKVDIKIFEMDETTASIGLSYILNREEVYYKVNEYYRIRYTASRTYLLDYDRDMDAVFDADDDSAITKSTVYLGITASDVNMMESEDGGVIAFVQNGALYSLREADSKIARVFSFFDNGGDDPRNLFDDHDIKIFSVDEAGNVQFMVYGYMNRGRHEGEVGVAVYYFNSSRNRLAEQVWIPASKSFEILKNDVELLSYTGGGNELSIYMDGAIYKVDLINCIAETVAGNLDRNSIMVSKNNRYVAWQSEDGATVVLANLSSGRKREITRGSDYEVTPLGFVGDDFVYGVSGKSDYIKNSSGVSILPMSAVYIEDYEGTTLKTYTEENIYITRAVVTDAEVLLKRIYMQSGSGSYSSVSDDEIVSNIEEEVAKNTISAVTIDNLETVVEIDLAHKLTAKVRTVKPEEVMVSSAVSLSIPTEQTDELYYVYSKGSITGIYATASEAVNAADTVAGIVVDNEQDYIWKKGDRKTETKITSIEGKGVNEGETSLAISLEEMLSNAGISVKVSDLLSADEDAMEIIEDKIQGSKALDLYGCSLSSVLYYVSQGTPVLARVDGGENVLIVGYDSKNTIIMDPTTGTVYKKGMNDSTAWFQTQGNEFVSYIMTE